MGKARHGSGGGGPGELRQSVKVGKLNLVDLAGSERVHITGATGWLNHHTSSSSTLPTHTHTGNTNQTNKHVQSVQMYTLYTRCNKCCLVAVSQSNVIQWIKCMHVMGQGPLSSLKASMTDWAALFFTCM